MPQKLTLEWIQLENGARALVYDADTWANTAAQIAALRAFLNGIS